MPQAVTTNPPRGLPAGRSFGGRLTRPGLDINATEFVPASLPPRPSSVNSSKPAREKQGPKKKHTPQRPSPSDAPDLATRLHDDIANGVYECAICSNEIARNSNIWSCRDCWQVLHIRCAARWATSKNDPEHGYSRGGWKCPNCNIQQLDLPTAYTCWCEKETNPRPIPGLPPHSCGQTCGRTRKFPRACPHPCDLVCHAGPCPPCTAPGPKQFCFCARTETQKRCAETDYEKGWSCGQACDELLPCGEHTCQLPCHEGLCGACPVEVPAKCYCGKIEKMLKCSERSEEKQSYNWTGIFDCGNVCDQPYDCGEHKCKERCHQQKQRNPHCPQSPDVITHCACGKTRLSELQVEPRESCKDPIPSCKQQCDRLLLCGHTCAQVCHPGNDCPLCTQRTLINCRCGRNASVSLCHQGQEEAPQCMRTCRATMNCGRHECGERCCTGEKKAAARLASKRKTRPLGATAPPRGEASVEPEHICVRECGRPLKCGNHDCTQLCHKGSCDSCREAVFDDLSCNCGRTVARAPLPCGSRPPKCNFPCQRPTGCGHQQVPHNCHLDSEECPKCPFLTEKRCLCSKKVLKNQPCWRSDGLCGIVCGKMLKCGSHTCQKTCHKDGECEDALQRCQQPCGKPKKACGHYCEQPCHAPSACKEDKPCPSKEIITCDCQRKKEEVRCNARTGVPVPSGRQTSLKCDDECARLVRNRTLAEALRIPDGHTDDHVPYSTQTLRMYLEDVAWAHKQEEIFRLFAADEQEKRFRFDPMKSHQRQFLHSLAEDFGLDTESVDPEPHRHIMLFRTPRFVSAPMKTLAQAARIRKAQLAVSAPAATPVVREPDYNGFLLRGLKFALTEEELRPVLKKVIPVSTVDVHFLSDEVALFPHSQIDLSTIQPTLSAAIISAELASSVLRAQLHTSGPNTIPVVVAVQTKSTPASSGGWSQVAAAAKRTTLVPAAPVGQKSLYTVLGSKMAERKKGTQANEKKLKSIRKEDVVDDWEAEVDKEGGVPADGEPGAGTPDE